jgi:hypothetical protein
MSMEAENPSRQDLPPHHVIMFAKENKNMKEKEKKKIKRKKPERNPIGRPIFLVMRGSLKRPYEVGRCRWWPITETTRTSSVPHFRRARPSPTHHILLLLPANTKPESKALPLS